MARGYVSMLTPNVGAAIPPVQRTRLVGGNDGSVTLSPGMSNGNKSVSGRQTGVYTASKGKSTTSKDHYKCGLDPNYAQSE